MSPDVIPLFTENLLKEVLCSFKTFKESKDSLGILISYETNLRSFLTIPPPQLTFKNHPHDGRNDVVTLIFKYNGLHRVSVLHVLMLNYIFNI